MQAVNLIKRVTLPLVVAIISLGLSGRSEAAPHVSLHYTNPVFAKDFPDPMVLRLSAHNYYAYATSVDWERGYFPILHSTDLVHWTHVGDALKRPPTWVNTDLWAPDVIKHRGTYYMYFTGWNTQEHCIGVATSSRPVGPFKYRNVVGCSFDGRLGFIDPDAFFDSNGDAYLYVAVDETGQGHVIAGVRLSPDLLHTSGAFHVLFGVTQPWETSLAASTVEGPFMVKHGGRYYMFYSGNGYEANYAMGYATSDSPLGTFTKYRGNPVLRADHRVKGPGGGSVVTGPDGKLWMAYHAWTGPEGYSKGGVRSLRIDRITWRNGIPSIKVHP